MNIKSAFAKRVIEAGLTLQDLAWLTNVSYKRIRLHSMGKLELTAAEMERVNAAVSYAAVVYTIYKREHSDILVHIKTGLDGVMQVTKPGWTSQPSSSPGTTCLCGSTASAQPPARSLPGCPPWR